MTPQDYTAIQGMLDMLAADRETLAQLEQDEHRAIPQEIRQQLQVIARRYAALTAPVLERIALLEQAILRAVVAARGSVQTETLQVWYVPDTGTGTATASIQEV